MDQNGKALVVEDEALLALEMQDVLRAKGFEAQIACTEAAALAVPPDDLSVAVVNLRLHDQLSGHGVIRHLRARRPDLPIVVVTGYDADAPQADLRGLGWPMARLQKPMRGDELGETVRRIIVQAQTKARPLGGRRWQDRTNGR